MLSYTFNEYSRCYKNEVIAGFTHTSLADGSVDQPKALEMVGLLNARSASPISFNPEMVRPALTGGACSAIAFRVAKETLPLLHKMKRSLDGEIFFAMKFSYRAIKIDGMATSQRSAEKGEQERIRTEQMALNTITVDRNVIRSGNAVRQKISAMASLYGLKVVDSTGEIRVKGNKDLKKELFEQMGKLQEGIYFLRIIQEKNNHKLEEKGHSVIYVKTANCQYYFDSALGSYSLFSGKPTLIYNALLSANERHGVDVLSFHRLEEANPISIEEFPFLDLNLKLFKPETSLGVVLFSPGLGVTVDCYDELAMNLSKEGYTVLSVDYPEETERLNEEEIIIKGMENGEKLIRLVEGIRSGQIPQVSREARVLAMGHSLGGSASVYACGEADIKAVINLDGRVLNGVTKPVLQVIAKKEKEDRTAYNNALEGLKEVERVELNVRHGEFSHTSPELLDQITKLSLDFLKRHTH